MPFGRRRIYLDHAATTPVMPAAAAAVAEALMLTGNASSVHAEGRAARSTLEAARRTVAAAVGGRSEHVIFTSGATEANALALLGLPGPALVSTVEHPSVLEQAETLPLVPVDALGRVRLDALEELLAEHRPALVSVMAANNETGVVQPLAEVARLARAAGALLHVDAVQAVGRLPLDAPLWGADLVSLSGHKLGGPQGAGALVMARDLPLTARQRGGGQEWRLRAGTENLSGIAGMCAALQCRTDWAAIRRLREGLEHRLAQLAPGLVVLGATAPRLPGIACLAIPGMKRELQLMALDLSGIAVSTGSACSSGKVARSHVLAAMDAPAWVQECAIRVSLGWTTTQADIAALLAAFVPLLARRGPVP